MSDRFFTFGSGHSSLRLGFLGSHYWVGDREKLFFLRGSEFAMEYPMEELDDMKFKWGLVEATDKDVAKKWKALEWANGVTLEKQRDEYVAKIEAIHDAL